MRLFVIWILLLSVLSPVTMNAQELSEQEAPPLHELIREALENNPGVESSRYREEATAQRPGQMRAWMPPEAGFRYNRQALGSPGSVDFMNVNTWSLSQTIPFPGKISARVDMAEAGHEMSGYDREDHEVWLAAKVKESYYDLWVIQKRLEVNSDLQGLLEKFVDSAGRMYEVGLAGFEAVLSAQTNLARLRTEERTLRNDYNKMRITVNQYLDREPDSTLGEITSLPAEELPGDLIELEQRMLNERPDILAMRSGIDMNAAEIRLARRDYYPDIMVEMMYMQMPAGMENQLGAMVSLQIPIAPWSKSKFSHRVNESRNELRSREKALENMTSMAQAEIRQAMLDLETQLDVIRLYREEVIPQAEETVESVSGSFQAGRTDYLMVLDSYRMLEISRLEYYLAQAEFHKSVAGLERQIGITVQPQ